MDKPDKIILSDGSYFSEGRSGVLAGAGILILAAIIIFTQMDMSGTTLMDFAGLFVLVGFWVIWMAFYAFLGLAHKFSDKRAINLLFEQEIWQQWQFKSDEWRGIVEKEYQTMRPEDGLGAYVGAVYSGCLGLVIAAILAGVGKFVVEDEQAEPIFMICAVAAFFLLVGVGLFQPLQQRNKARKYLRRTLRVLAPRVWFGRDGIYHEAFGYTSLKDLEKVNDHRKKLKTIKFTVKVVTVMGSSGRFSRSIDFVPLSFSVPSGYDEEAARLVHRYRLELLQS